MDRTFTFSKVEWYLQLVAVVGFPTFVGTMLFTGIHDASFSTIIYPVGITMLCSLVPAWGLVLLLRQYPLQARLHDENLITLEMACRTVTLSTTDLYGITFSRGAWLQTSRGKFSFSYSPANPALSEFIEAVKAQNPKFRVGSSGCLGI
jgi:hypothetical protein